MNPLQPVDTLPGRRPRPRKRPRHGLLRRLGIWRAMRTLRRSRYDIGGTRPYRGVFAPGFLAFVRNARFWDSRAPGGKPRRGDGLKRLAALTLGIAASAFAVWFVVVSIRGLATFR